MDYYMPMHFKRLSIFKWYTNNELEILFHWNICVAWHSIETCIPSLEWFGSTVTKLCSGQENLDAAADDTDDDAAADKSNPYMLPFQAT